MRVGRKARTGHLFSNIIFSQQTQQDNKLSATGRIRSTKETRGEKEEETYLTGMYKKYSTMMKTKTEMDEEDASASSSSYSNSAADRTASSDATSSKQPLAKKESVYVSKLRILFFIVLLCAAIGCAVVVYITSTRSEEQEFEVAFYSSAQKIVNSFQDIITQKLGAIASLGVMYTSYARDKNLTWPMVTMNDFQQRAQSALFLSKALFLEICPIVEEDAREEWENYTVTHNAWLEEGRAIRNAPPPADAQLLEEGPSRAEEAQDPSTVVSMTGGLSTIGRNIYYYNDIGIKMYDDRPGPYFPVWQSSPILPLPRDSVNFNLNHLDHYKPYFKLLRETGQFSIGAIDVQPAGGVDHPNIQTNFFAFIMSMHAGRNVMYNGDPMATIWVPVFDSYETQSKKTVAVLKATIHWGTYLDGIVRPGSKPLRVVLENECTGPFTYDISGDGVAFIGVGDLHDPQFDDVKLYTDLSLSGWNTTDGENSATEYVLNQDMCQYGLHVYPTTELQSDSISNAPITITIVVASMFVFTALMFLLYDRIVAYRNKVIMNMANRTTAIVSSLFPAQVRSRLFEEQDDQHQEAPNVSLPKNNNKSKKKKNNRGNLKTFLSEDCDSTIRQGDGVYKSKPIADLFPEVTVLFADIAGFTAWSSVREPASVFTLLETLYHAFDELAERRRIFKVETVGDCYVAASGVPDTRKDHAVAVARFARDCMYKMSIITKDLEVSLGPGTGDLNMRIGIHSGAVTAGVLRGKNSRFQVSNQPSLCMP